MERKIRVGAVSYLNTKPLVFEFERGAMCKEMDLLFDYPANIAAMLLADEIDLGLIPVAVIPKLYESYILSDFCIGASSAVASVCLFSDVPLSEITHILMDYQSRTSAALLRILVKHHWKIDPQFVDTKNGYQESIIGTTAGLVIGDRALKQRLHSTYTYDLAIAWREMTGLPFVFAAWVANKPLPVSFITNFNAYTGNGLNHLPEIVLANPFKEYDLMKYYSKNIDYKLDDKKKEALEVFFRYLQT